jgi:release factor glutamine methyltransferase
MTVLEVLQSTKTFLEKRGIENPRLNIEHLLAHVLHKNRMDLYLQFDQPLTEAELDPLRALVRRRAQGEPLQHLLGTVEFLGRTFAVDRRALIPRPETEQLVELVLARAGGCQRILDVGTGSGVIAVTLAAEIPAARVEAVDISPDALALAGENAARHGMTERITFHTADLLGEIAGPFDLIIANLPYIPSGDLPHLAREVQYDPRLALDGGPEGLDLIRRLLDDATTRLRGELVLEIGHAQADPVAHALTARHYRDIAVSTDYQGRNRFVFAKYG